jgi:hypothetical protein
MNARVLASIGLPRPAVLLSLASIFNGLVAGVLLVLVVRWFCMRFIAMREMRIGYTIPGYGVLRLMPLLFAAETETAESGVLTTLSATLSASCSYLSLGAPISILVCTIGFIDACPIAFGCMIDWRLGCADKVVVVLLAVTKVLLNSGLRWTVEFLLKKEILEGAEAAGCVFRCTVFFDETGFDILAAAVSTVMVNVTTS